MFVVTEADAAAIRAVYEQRGEFAAAIELRRLFPGITDNAQARDCATDHRGLEAAATGENVCPNHVTEEPVPCRSPTF